MFKDLTPFKTSQSYQTGLSHLQQQIKDIFEDWGGSPTEWAFAWTFPALEISETDKEMIIKAEIPGVDEQELKVEAYDNQLTIRGEKKATLEKKDRRYRLQEMTYGQFSRTTALPFAIDPDKIQAEYNKGVLTLRIEKPSEQARKVKEIPLRKATS